MSGNPAGRRKGSRNRWRRADPERAAHWTAGEWRLHFARTMSTAQGNPGQRAAAAYAECQRLWRQHHPPKALRGMCAQCKRPLNPPNPTFDGAPVPFDDSFVHHGCLRQFALSRWHEATAALALFGISV